MACAVTRAVLSGEMSVSPVTSGFMAVSDAPAGLAVVVYRHSEGSGEVYLLSGRNEIEPRHLFAHKVTLPVQVQVYLHQTERELILFSLNKHDTAARGCLEDNSDRM